MSSSEHNPCYWRNAKGKLKRHVMPKDMPKPKPGGYPVIITTESIEEMSPDSEGSLLEVVKQKVKAAEEQDRSSILLRALLAAFANQDSQDAIYEHMYEETFGEPTYESEISLPGVTTLEDCDDMIKLSSNYIFGCNYFEDKDCALVGTGIDQVYIPETLADTLAYESADDGWAVAKEKVKIGQNEVFHTEDFAVVIHDKKPEDITGVEHEVFCQLEVDKIYHFELPAWYREYRTQIHGAWDRCYKNTVLTAYDINKLLYCLYETRKYTYAIAYKKYRTLPASVVHYVERNFEFQRFGDNFEKNEHMFEEFIVALETAIEDWNVDKSAKHKSNKGEDYMED